MATCFSARSHRNCSAMPVSCSSSGSGGPMLSISARVRMDVWDMFGSLSLVVLFTAGDNTAVVLRQRECSASGIGFHGAANTLVEISKTSQSERVHRIDRTRGFVVTNRVVFTTKTLEHLRGVQISR